MGQTASTALEMALQASLGWWREAGVDCAFADEPVQWLTGPEAEPEPNPALPVLTEPPKARRSAAPSGAETPILDRSVWPDSLPRFTEWWLTDPALDNGRTSGRVPPRGATGAEWMIVVPEPEAGDSESLLSGPQGRLLDGFLRATGITAEDAYICSILPRHMPFADWPAIVAAGFADLLAHHVALVRPTRLIALTGNTLPLPGNDPPNNSHPSRRFNHEGGQVPLFVARPLATLLERPRWKAGLWQGWLDWTRGDAASGQ
jgi:uracil-DNA glycosylase